jgi:methyl-accepting chemotaxis protein
MKSNKNLDMLRNFASKALIIFLWMNLPLSIIIGISRNTNWILSSAIIAIFSVIATLSWKIAGNILSTRLIVSVSVMGIVSIIVYQMSGHPWQTDMHMYFFAALAGLVAYCDFRTILIATAVTAMHHLVLNFLLPGAIYPGGSDFFRVVLHAVILILESSVLIWISYSLAKTFTISDQQFLEIEKNRIIEKQLTSERIEIETRNKIETAELLKKLSNNFQEK